MSVGESRQGGGAISIVLWFHRILKLAENASMNRFTRLPSSCRPMGELQNWQGHFSIRHYSKERMKGLKKGGVVMREVQNHQ